MSTANQTKQPSVIELPAFTVIGISYEANLQEIMNSDIGKNAYLNVVSRKNEFELSSEHVHLVQIYPMKMNFNPHVDRFTQIIGYVVPEGTAPPTGMISHRLPERKYVTVTHRGLESDLSRTYELLYDQWMSENGRLADGFDFEVWDERYKPDQEDNEIDVFVALKSEASANVAETVDYKTALTEKRVLDPKLGFELQDLRDLEIEMACFKGSRFGGIDMRDTSFVHTNFVNSKWEHIYFSNLHINMIQMGGTVFENIKRPDAVESRFTEEAGTDGWVNVEPVTFKNCDLAMTRFESCNLSHVELNGCNIEGLTINGVSLSELLVGKGIENN